MNVVQKRGLGTELRAQLREHRRHVAQIGRRVPRLLERARTAAGRLVGAALGRHAVDAAQFGTPTCARTAR